MRRPLALLIALLCGCDEQRTAPPEFVSVPVTSADSAAVEEPSWNAQVAAIRSGASSEIRVASPVSSQQFRDLAEGCDGLTTLVLEDATLDDGDLAVLPVLPRLRWIKLPFVVNDAGADAIGRCPALEIVNRPDTAITDAGLARIAGLPRL